MATSQKILGQASLLENNLTNIYVVPIEVSTTISSIVVCNRNLESCKFRISVAKDGAVDHESQYIFYDVLLDANETYVATIGITLSSGDIVRVYSSNQYTSVNIFGIEVQ